MPIGGWDCSFMVESLHSTHMRAWVQAPVLPGWEGGRREGEGGEKKEARVREETDKSIRQ